MSKFGPNKLLRTTYGAQFTHLHIPSLCKEFFEMRHNIGHSNLYIKVMLSTLHIVS